METSPQSEPEQNDFFLLDLSIIISERDGKPVLELRRSIVDPEIIKLILSSAFHERPVIMQPTFRNKHRTINALMEKKIIERKENDLFFII